MEIIPIYIFSFIALYAQVYLFIVLFEEWDTIFPQKPLEPKHLPTVSIAVPCWNEGKTVEATVDSLLKLDYPKDKLQIWVVDDGSTDNTWEIIQKFADTEKYPQLTVRHKENGGKHTVLNYVIENTQAEVFGCLDADSYVLPDTLKNMVREFEDEKVMAVTPMLIVKDPKNLIQAMQSVEYNVGLIIRKIFSPINAIHVTPGPFSLFRKVVFEKIGGYRPAHNTEDMEITFRMQKNFMKIVSSTNAFVETSTPDTIKKIYKQRVRWTQGFMQNSIDYSEMIFRPKYGSIGMFTLPFAWLGILAFLYSFITFISYSLYDLYKWAVHLSSVGLNLNFPNLSDFYNYFFFQTNFLSIIALPVFISGLTFIIMGHHMSISQTKRWYYIIYYIFLWWFLLPLWLTRSLYNTLKWQKTSWR